MMRLVPRISRFGRSLNLRVWVACALPLLLAAPVLAQTPPSVTVTETAREIVMDNGVVTVEISKAKGQVTSIHYRHDGRETEMANTMYSSYSAGSLEKDAPRGGSVTAVRAWARLTKQGPDMAEAVMEDGPEPAYPFHTETHYR